jgi:hypothetical protein
VGTLYAPGQLPPLYRRRRIACRIAELPLAPGVYTLCLGVGTLHSPLLDALEDSVQIEIEPGDFYGNGQVAHSSLGRILVRSAWEALD